MNVITLSEDAFYSLLNEVIKYVQEQHKRPEQRFISKKEAMQRLGIKSPTTLQKLRDTQSIRFSQVTSRTILYDVQSIDDYLNKKAIDTL